jgi:hypothetical protein
MLLFSRLIVMILTASTPRYVYGTELKDEALGRSRRVRTSFIARHWRQDG